MFGIIDKRKSELKTDDSPFAARALELYCEDSDVAYKTFLAGTGGKDCWKEYKIWLRNWIMPEGLDSDEKLVELYLLWFETDYPEQSQSARARIKAMWASDENEFFSPKNGGSCVFFLFAAFLEAYAYDDTDDLVVNDQEKGSSGSKVEPSEQSGVDEFSATSELTKVRELFDSGLIDEDEYKALKKKILGL